MFSEQIYQMRLPSMSMFSEIAESLGLEILIFVITALFAVAFRRRRRHSHCSSRVKLVDECPQIIKPPQSKLVNTPESSKNQRQQPSAHSEVSGGNLTRQDASQKAEMVLQLANRRQAVDAMALYEELRSNHQQEMVRACLCNRKQRPIDVFGMLTQCAVRAGRPELIELLLDDMALAGVHRSLPFYESVMKVLASKKCYREAMSVYSRLEADGLEPSPVTLSCLINFAVEIGELDRAIGFFERLAESSTPSIRAYMMILRVHSKRQDWTKSVEVIRHMQKRRVKIDELVLNVVLATGVAAGQLDDGLALLHELAHIADVVSYNTMMKGFAQQRKIDRAVQLLEAMQESTVKPNAITFNTAIDAAIRSSRVSAAWDVLAKMRDAGHAPDKFTCTTLMKGLQDGATSEQLIVLLDLMQKMTSQHDAILCGSLFRSVIELAAQMNDPVLTQRAVAQMREQQVMLPPQEYQRLLHTLTQQQPSSIGAS
jgi:pentatricopeptide repeat protein